MQHYVAYHSLSVMGHAYSGGRNLTFFSGKPRKQLEKAIGQLVWVVTSDDHRPKRYFLAGIYSPREILADNGSSTIVGTGTPFEPPIEITAFEWFKELQDEQNNFSYGFNRIKAPAIVQSLEKFQKPPSRALPAVGTILTNRQLMDQFQIGMSGGMRRSRRQRCLVVVSDHTKAIYHDRWDGKILHYTGMGLKGDQRLASQNLTLRDSATSGVLVHLFEVHVPGRYEYKGLVGLAGDPYQEMQSDTGGNDRKVWMFPISLLSRDAPVSTPLSAINSANEKARRKSRMLNNAELAARVARKKRRAPGVSTVTTNYYRDAEVAEYALRRAGGKCDLCTNPAPFSGTNGEPFLEVHHVIWLSRDGLDSIENTVALCPNCHRKVHQLELPQDISSLKQAAMRTLDLETETS
jgi:5-methylcytosine-specific restriction enzyme A